MQPAFNSDLFQQLLEPENLHRAWRQVKANKGAAGIDGMTIEAFPLWMQQGGWQQCKTQLELGEYQPSAVRRVEIDKPDGGKRKLGIPNVIDRVNHDLLMTQLRGKVQDKRLLALIGKYLRAGVMVNDQFEASFEGVPQGGPLSPLLSNIMLDSLDQELESRGHKFARYADDFIILVKSIRAGERVLKRKRRDRHNFVQA